MQPTTHHSGRALPPVWLSLLIAAALQAACWPVVTLDMRVWLLPWLDHIVEAGPVGAFAAPFSNYAPPYLYLLTIGSLGHGWLASVTIIKLVALAGLAPLYVAVQRLLRAASADQPGRGAALVLALPSVVLNTGWMGQCDPFWAAALVMAVAMAAERRHAAMLGWCGLAVAFKAQALFAAPFFLALVISRRVPLRLLPVAPAVTLMAMLPAWAAGWPASDLATIYLRQSGTFGALSMNAPNIWSVVGVMPIPPVFSLDGVAFIAAAAATVCYIAWFASRPIEGRALLPAALLAPLLTAGLLPHMHERYFFLADVLALVLALAARDRGAWKIACFVQLGSATALLAFILEWQIPAALGGLSMIFATDLVVRRLRSPATGDTISPRHALAA